MRNGPSLPRPVSFRSVPSHLIALLCCKRLLFTLCKFLLARIICPAQAHLAPSQQSNPISCGPANGFKKLLVTFGRMDGWTGQAGSAFNCWQSVVRVPKRCALFGSPAGLLVCLGLTYALGVTKFLLIFLAFAFGFFPFLYFFFFGKKQVTGSPAQVLVVVALCSWGTEFMTPIII